MGRRLHFEIAMILACFAFAANTPASAQLVDFENDFYDLGEDAKAIAKKVRAEVEAGRFELKRTRKSQLKDGVGGTYSPKFKKGVVTHVIQISPYARRTERAYTIIHEFDHYERIKEMKAFDGPGTIYAKEIQTFNRGSWLYDALEKGYGRPLRPKDMDALFLYSIFSYFLEVSAIRREERTAKQSGIPSPNSELWSDLAIYVYERYWLKHGIHYSETSVRKLYELASSAKTVREFFDIVNANPSLLSQFHADNAAIARKENGESKRKPAESGEVNLNWGPEN